MNKKICINCNLEYELSDYNLAPNNKDGRRNICRACEKEKWNGGNKWHGLEDSKLPQDEIEMARHVLLTLGYELDNPENPVYLQFNERLLKKGIDVSPTIKKTATKIYVKNCFWLYRPVLSMTYLMN